MPIPILIVDDRPENLTALEALLADLDLGFELVRALSGQEALRATLKQDFALVLLDVQMPDMDGFETAELMRSNPKTQQIPIIFVTAGMKELSHQFKGYGAGAVDYLAKPIEPAFLRGKVKVFSELYQQRKALEELEQGQESLVQVRTAALLLEIQQHKRTEEALRQEHARALKAESQQRQLETELHHVQKMESVGHMAGAVAHDINNVLSAILSLNAFLKRRCADDPVLLTVVASLEDAALRGRDQLKGLTDFARTGLEHPSPLNLNELVRLELGFLSRNPQGRVEVQLELEDRLPLLLGEAPALGQVIMNLCVNAVEAMPDGGRLSFRTRSLADEQVELELEDSGTGMSADVRLRAMDPYFTTKPEAKAKGLGLSIVYGVVKAHGGTVRLDSEVGRGTRVQLRFPAMVRHAASPEGDALPGLHLSPKRILLVDDEEMVTFSASLILEDLGHKVDTATGGMDALVQLNSGLRPDLVILDNNMPFMRGEEALGKIRTMRPGLPIILASGTVDDALRASARDLSGVCILEKPFTMNGLAEALGSLFGA